MTMPMPIPTRLASSSITSQPLCDFRNLPPHHPTYLPCSPPQRHLDIAKLLLMKGASVNAKNIYSKTALYNAACDGDIKTAELLLDHGADVEIRAEHELDRCVL